jgi:hypothetical protein
MTKEGSIILPDDKNNPGSAIYNVPPEGSLGLLAFGHRGVAAWRKKREEMKALAALKEKKDE